MLKALKQIYKECLIGVGALYEASLEEGGGALAAAVLEDSAIEAMIGANRCLNE